LHVRTHTKRIVSGRPLPSRLRVALETAGFAHLSELAEAIGLQRNTLEAIRCGARRLTGSRRAQIAKALRIEPKSVDAVLFARAA
jgi:transcriptional regulator with XRE-family HTH domain